MNINGKIMADGTAVDRSGQLFELSIFDETGRLLACLPLTTPLSKDQTTTIVATGEPYSARLLSASGDFLGEVLLEDTDLRFPDRIYVGCTLHIVGLVLTFA